jgi:hypothetical protein
MDMTIGGCIDNGDMNQSCKRMDTVVDGVVMHDATGEGGEPRDLQSRPHNNRARSACELISSLQSYGDRNETLSLPFENDESRSSLVKSTRVRGMLRLS